MTTDLQVSDLVPGTWYEFTHTRKGVFRGQFIELDFDIGDVLDEVTGERVADPESAEVYATVDMHTATGFGGERLAHGPGRDPETGEKIPTPEFTRCKLLAKLLTKITPLVP